MARLHLAPTVLAQWYELVQEAENNCGKKLGDELESYLVRLLQYFMTKPDIANSVLAEEYLHGEKIKGKECFEKLREVGDKCLLFSGLFPENAAKRHVDVTYFIDMGQSAYHLIWLRQKNQTQLAELFHRLEKDFVDLKNTLQNIREMSDQPLAQKIKNQSSLQRFYQYNSNAIIASINPEKKLH